MRILVVGDLHGKTPEITQSDFDVIISVGDVCGDEGFREYMNTSLKLYMQQGEDAPTWYELCGEDKANKLLDKSLQQGRETMKLLNSFGVPVYAIPGNWDWTGEESTFERLNDNLYEQEVIAGLDNVVNVDSALVETDWCSIVGYGRVNGPELLELRGYEHVTPEEIAANQLDYEELYEEFATLCSQAQKPILLLSHNVPYNTSIDQIVNPDSPQDKKHFGSVLARDVITDFDVFLCVGGHMHEHYGTDMINDTVCFNAGFGPDKTTIIEFSTPSEFSILLHE